MARILALDPGKACGWALSDTDGPGTCGTRRFRECDDIGHLVHAYAQWLGAVLDTQRPGLVAVERPFGRASFTADMPLVLVGITHGLCHARGIERVEFTASSLKKRITGSGKADKKLVVAAVRALGWSPDTDHAADACACLLAAAGYEAAPEAPAPRRRAA